MRLLKSTLLKFKPFLYYIKGKRFLNDLNYLKGRKQDEIERSKSPSKTVVLNYLLSSLKRKTSYLEIGVRNPINNFNHIKVSNKYSVDPGIEFKENPVDFPLTSDDFFERLYKNEILSDKIRFDLIFIDGLHLAKQVDRDIKNAMNFIKDDGFIVIHDCNPPTEWHARTEYYYTHTPAGVNWNGTTWKAFLKWRTNQDIHSCCIDTDWGIGILSKQRQIGKPLQKKIEFYEFQDLDNNRSEYLNLTDFEDFKKMGVGFKLNLKDRI